ncbi:MAG: polyphosphate polymerase domain-containing protein [Chitinispirillaceae bacterium]|nr:polyphosphate polymerase domain-containing protein [Chitinispirillaceae bacterium]
MNQKTVIVHESHKKDKQKQEGIPPVLERYEAKYTIPLWMVDDISRFIEPYCSLDAYSEKSPDLYYTINSLYFDTPDYLFLWLRLQKACSRINMRVRTYGERPTLPWFLEIKHKRGDIMRKYRARIHSEHLETMLQTPELLHHHVKDEKEENNRLLFYRLVQSYNARPKVLIQYKRKAYISDCEEYARVTFDIQLRSMRQTGYDPLPHDDALLPCDVQNIYDSGAGVILELKCYTSYVPLWMIDLVRTFQLYRRGFSKYMAGLRQVANSHDTSFNPMVRSLLSDEVFQEEMTV